MKKEWSAFMAKRVVYNNDAYKEAITEFFGDIFYLPGQSYGTRIQKLRQYTEIILRRILEYPCDNNIEIGNVRTIEKLDNKGFTEPLFRDSLEIIRTIGNERTHTKFRKVATEEEYQEILDSLFNIYGYLFYKYFEKWTFGQNDRVMSAFSCLPPIIRHIALSALYDIDPLNPNIVEKLVLAKLKSFDKQTADAWLEEHKDTLLGVHVSFDSDQLKQLIAKIGAPAAVAIAANMQRSMYDYCKEKIQVLDAALDSKPMFTDFEGAKHYYEKYGIVEGTSQEVEEFNDLMEFVYIGRRKNETEIASIPEENYIISQIVIFSPGLWGQGDD